MKLILGILLFTLSITTASNAHAAEITPTAVIANPEILDREYVSLNLSNDSAVSLSILDTAKNLTESLATKFHSLLNWQSHRRSGSLEVNNYHRTAQFGRWINDPNDTVCFNTRAKVLVRDSVKNVNFKDNNRCVVQNGAWNDPYTTSTIKESRDVQIDHLVPLKNAYLSGAHRWSFRARCLYANYLGTEFHLLSVDGIENMKKGDRTPDSYMPPNQEYSCTYVRNWLAVKMLWGLTMSTTEAEAIHQVILDNKCNLTEFRVSKKELEFQNQFEKDNIDLCEKIDKETQASIN